MALTACSGPSGTDDDRIGVTLIVKTNSNPFYVAMQDAAETAAVDAGVDLTMAAGKEDGDEETQIKAIEDAIVRGDAGILIVTNGPGVLDAIAKARDAGLYVIGLDTPPDPADAVDINFASDNRLAGQLIGEWAAGTLAGQDAVIGMIDAFDDKVVGVDVNRDQGFLEGMGIPLGDEGIFGDEPPTGTYTGGDGGNYVIVGNQASVGSEDGGLAATETLLSINPDINVIYTVNEPTAYGVNQALQAAGKTGVIVVSIDGGCGALESIADGSIGATGAQRPDQMAVLGIDAMVELVKNGTKPEVTEGLDFFNTGITLVTDSPVAGVDSIDSTAAQDTCWG
jgi:fructose transport system substrate-binding protein